MRHSPVHYHRDADTVHALLAAHVAGGPARVLQEAQAAEGCEPSTHSIMPFSPTQLPDGRSPSGRTAGIRGMDMTIAMNKLQSSINVMLKGQAFIVSRASAYRTDSDTPRSTGYSICRG